MKASSSVYPVPFADFKRICSVIYAVLKNEGYDLRTSCSYINIFGAEILRKHYKINAKVVAGAAFYNLTSANDILLLSTPNCSSSESAFHCWIDTGQWIIDFASPKYSEMLKLNGLGLGCESKIFQRKLDQMSESHNVLEKVGDFCLSPNPMLTNYIVSNFNSDEVLSSLLKIICEWYIPPPKKISNTIPAFDEVGRSVRIELLNVNVLGFW